MTGRDEHDYRELLARSLHTIEELEAKVAALERSRREPIAVVGMGCRFPAGADDPDRFWRLLREGVDAVTEVPPTRWDVDATYDPTPGMPGKSYTRWGGFLDDVDRFDPQFFGISPREARSADPQQRLLLEVAWESLENAGLSPAELGGSRTGVFVGLVGTDYAHLQTGYGDPEKIDAHFATGASHSVAAGRISYGLGLHGPSVAIDTACSSSLVAVHLAVQSLRSGESELALAGGVNVILIDQGNVVTSQARMMSPEGRCKAFAAGADGYVRGEGCGVVVLKRLTDALADGDEVLAVIAGSAVNQDGRSNGLAAPNGAAQEAVIRAALEDAGISPLDVDVVEAHGTGTSLGDPIELEALAATYGAGRPRERPLLVGSVKTNVGHTEGAAGIAGVIKAVLALREREIPPHLHFHEPSPFVDWEHVPLAVPTEPTPWPEPTGRPRHAAVSSFGFSGTNAHVVLAEASPREREEAPPSGGTQVLPLSARTPAALEEAARRYERFLIENEDVALADVSLAAGTGRSHFEERLAVVAATHGEARERLAAWLSSGAATGVHRGSVAGERAPELAFLFTGQGAQYAGMGRGLYEREPVFRDALDRCADLLADELERPLLDVLYPAGGESPIDHTAYAQPALFALEWALTELWRSWGVRPAAVAGHSLGEYVAACVAGVFGLEDALRLVAARGRLMGALPAGGGMAAVFADEETVAAAVGRFPEALAVAAVNAPGEVVISGAADALADVLAELAARGVKSRELTVSHAFHSPLIEPMLDEFEAVVASLELRRPELTFVSALTGGPVDEEVLAPRFWRRHVREPVRFAAAVSALRAEGAAAFLEVGPTPTLTGLARRCLPGDDCLWLASLRRDRDERDALLESVAALYAAGAAIDWRGLHRRPRPSRPVGLPTYPFQRSRYWLELGDGPGGRPAGTPTGHRLLGNRLHAALPIFESELSLERQSELSDHRIGGRAVLPGAAMAELALAAAAEALGPEARALADLAIREPLLLPESGSGSVTVQTALVPDEAGGAAVRIASRREGSDAWAVHAVGTLRPVGEEDVELPPGGDDLAEALDTDDFYERLADAGADYGPAFRLLRDIRRRDGAAVARVDTEHVQADGYRVHPSLVDACLQLVGPALPGATGTDAEDSVYLPVAIGELRALGEPAAAAWCSAVVRSEPGAERLLADAVLLDAGGAPVTTLRGLEFERRTPAADALGPESSLYRVEWRERPRDGSLAEAAGEASWLLLAAGDATSAALARLLEERGDRCLLVEPGDGFARSGERSWRVSPDRPEDLRRLLAEVRGLDGPPLRGVAHLWALAGAAETPLEAQALGVGAALHLVQALAAEEAEEPPALLFATRGAQPPSPSADGTGAFQAPLWGFARAVALEHPRLRPFCVDLDPQRVGGEELELLLELLAPDGEDQVALRAGRRHVARLVRHAPANEAAGEPEGEREPLRVGVTSRGTLDGLRLAAVERRPPAAGEVEVEIRAAGLNFRDVLNVLGMYPGDPGPLGSECAGVVSAVGEGVDHVGVGDEVIALGPGTFGTFLTTQADFVARMPARLRFEEAATLPICFLTADYGLRRLAGLRSGQRVLVHAAAGGVGLAAVRIAQSVGAEVLATAGSPAKRAYLRSRGVRHVMDSRSTDFAAEVLAATGGEGVDVVLNALVGEFIPASLSVLRTGGWFLEIGKREIWDDERVAEHRPGVHYVAYDLAETFSGDTPLARSLLHGLVADVDAGALEPLPLRVFPLERARDAFASMARARHIGKVVIAPGGDSAPATPEAPPESEPELSPAHAYLVTGGLGALGLEVARALAGWGARRLVLVGRSQPGPEAEAALEELRADGIEVQALRADVADRGQARELLAAIEREAPLGGVVHAAGVVDDAALLNQTRERFGAVLAPKVAGAWNLHELTRDRPLEFFVLFSSTASLLGNAGQTNYAAANAFLEALAHARRAEGLPALAVNWGPWRGRGMAARLDDRRGRWSRLGMRMLAQREGVAALGLLLRDRSGVAQAAVVPIDWSRLARGLATPPPLLEELLPRTDDAPRRAPAVDAAGFLRRFEEAAPAERRALLDEHVREQVAAVLALEPDAVDGSRSFAELGMDSLLAVEVTNALQASLGRPLSSTLALEHPTLGELAGHLAGLLGADEPPAADEPTAAEEPPPLVPRADRDAPAPLSFSQQRIWMLEQFGQGAANVTALAARLEGALDVGALERAFAEVVRRHDVLRARFPAVEGSPVQELGDPPPQAIPVDDLSGLDEATREAEVRRLAAEAAGPFDVARDPLLRLRLLRLGAEEHLFLVSVHHLVADGWSTQIMLGEVRAAYGAFVAGEQPALAELPLQFADYAVWQQDAAETFAGELAFWRAKLGGDVPRAEIRPDRVRPPVQGLRGGEVHRSLAPEAVAALEGLARSEGGTLFMVLLTGLKVLLARHSGVHDVTVGSATGGRMQAEVERLIGSFSNTLALRTDLGGDPTFAESLRRVREVCLEAYAHQRVPFERVLTEVKPAWDASRTPLFQVFFNLLEFPEPQADLPGVRATPVEPAESAARFDLSFTVRRDGDGLRVTALYDADLFERARVEELLGQLELLLRQAAERPLEPVGRLSLVTEVARAATPDPGAGLPVSAAEPLLAAIARVAADEPGRTALAGPGETLTYGALERDSTRLAHVLLDAGTRPGDVVAVDLPAGGTLAIALLGVLKARAAFLVLDPADPPAWRGGSLRAAGALVLLGGTGELAETAETAIRVEPGLGVLEGASDETCPQRGPGDPAYVALLPRAGGGRVAVTAGLARLSHAAAWQRDVLGLAGGDRVAFLSRPALDPLLRDLLAPLGAGATVCIPGADELAAPGTLGEWLAREHVTVAAAAPSVARRLAAAEPGALPGLRLAVLAGERLHVEDVAGLRRAAPNARVVSLYAPAVAPEGAGWSPVDALEPGAVAPAGRGIEGVQLLVRNEHGVPAGVGERGEVVVRGPRSGEDDPAPLATGDLGAYRLDGAVDLFGRSDDEVVLGGVRLSLGEVDAALGRHPAVREAAAVPDRVEVPQLLAHVALEPGATADATALRAFVREQLPAAAVPAAVAFVDALPRTAGGDVDRRALEAAAARGAYEAPAPGLEELVAQAWREVLEIDSVSASDNFFDLGGQSLGSVRVAMRLQQELGVQIQPQELAYASLRQFAAAVERELERGGNGAASNGGRVRRRLGLLRARRASR